MNAMIGIDLGTTNSLVAILEGEKPVLLPNVLGERSTPSVVGLTPQGQLLVGRSARNQLAVAPDRTIAEMKRQMGSTEGIVLGDRSYTATELSSFVLMALKEDAERYLGQPVTEAVITVPAYFTDAQRHATREAGVLAGLKVERILNEPTAAALAYGLTHLDQEAHVLVYDLGGGTFDVSILEMYSGVLDVRASSGNARLGGSDFDALVVRWLLDQIQQEHGLDLRGDRAAMARLKLAAEQAKIELSAQSSATIQLPFLAMKGGSPISPLLELDRTTFEALIGPLVRSTLEPVAAALRDAKLVPAQIGEILLVGGSSRIPLVQRLVEEYFHQKPRFEVNPDEAVALGAAIQAGLKGGAFSAETGIMITDVAPFTLGVESSRRVGQSLVNGFFLPIIPRNSTIPITRSQVVNTVADGQTRVTVRVFQGDDHLCKNNVFLDEYHIQDIPSGRAGQERLEIAFTYDINGILQVKTTIMSTGRAATLRISRAAPSPDSQARLSADYGRAPERSLEAQVEHLLSQGKAEAAVELAERHAATSPGAESQLFWARALLGAGRAVPAERMLRSLVAEAGAPARKLLGQALAQTGRGDEALVELEAAEARAEAGWVALRLGHGGRALGHLRAALVDKPGDPSLLEAYERATLLANDPADLYFPLSARHPDWLWGRFRAGLKQPPLCDSPLIKAAEAGMIGQERSILGSFPPSSTDPLPSWLRLLGLLLDRTFPEAERQLTDMITRWPALAVARALLAQLQADRPALALSSALRWTELSPHDPEAWEALGDSHWAGKAPEAARAAWLRAETAGSETATQKIALAARLQGRAGLILALGWHPRGGTTIPVQALRVPGDGSLQVTGNMSHLCEEAAKVAWTCLRGRAREFSIPTEGVSLHLHFSSLTLEKDGPSAGVAFFLAALSAMQDRPLPPDLAATGEVDLMGGVRPVGGLEEKLRAAALAGVRRVIVPRQNLPQLQALPLDLRSQLMFHYVSTVVEAAGFAWP